jgi:anti-sigma factor RsiW
MQDVFRRNSAANRALWTGFPSLHRSGRSASVVISADELHAYVDSALPPARHIEAAAYLAENPCEAAAVEAFRAQIAGMKALFDVVLDEPVPRRLRGVLRQAPTRRALPSSWVIGASIAAAVVVAGGTLVAQSHLAMVGSTTIHIPAAVRSQPPAEQRLPVLPPPTGGPKRPRSADI